MYAVGIWKGDVLVADLEQLETMDAPAHRQVDEQPSKRSTKNDDKSAVAMLKKHELHERTRQLVVNRDHCRYSKYVILFDSGSIAVKYRTKV